MNYRDHHGNDAGDIFVVTRNGKRKPELSAYVVSDACAGTSNPGMVSAYPNCDRSSSTFFHANEVVGRSAFLHIAFQT